MYKSYGGVIPAQTGNKQISRLSGIFEVLEVLFGSVAHKSALARTLDGVRDFALMLGTEARAAARSDLHV